MSDTSIWSNSPQEIRNATGWGIPNIYHNLKKSMLYLIRSSFRITRVFRRTSGTIPVEDSDPKQS